MVAAVAAVEPDTVALLVGEDAPPVDLLLVDPAVTVERLADEGRGHWRVLRDHERSSYLRVSQGLDSLAIWRERLVHQTYARPPRGVARAGSCVGEASRPSSAARSRATPRERGGRRGRRHESV